MYYDFDNEAYQQEREEREKARKRKLKGGVIILAIVIVSLLLGILCVEKIPRGYVGAVYSIRGGTSQEVLTEGWHVVAPTKKVTEYSVATEQLLMNKDNEESFKATCKDGVLTVDIEASYHFDAEDIPSIAKRYRGLSGESIVDTRVKSKIKTYVNEVTSKYTVLEAYMDKKSEVNTELTKKLQEKLKDYGVVIESATISRAEPDKAIKTAITERSKKAQEVEAAKLEQQKQKILAETKRIEAEGEAAAAVEKAQGEAKANKLLSDSLTDKLLKSKELEARQKHGWVTIQGAGNTIVDATK